jgi:hypothetical protein
MQKLSDTFLYQYKKTKKYFNKVMDEKRQQLTSRSSDHTPSIEDTVFFTTHGREVYLLEKANKIIKASYLISEHLKDDEPLRKNIRQSSIALIKDFNPILSFRDNKRHYAQNLYTLMSFISIGRDIGLLSPLNADVTNGVILSFIQEIDVEVDDVDVPTDQQRPLSQDFFTVDTAPKSIQNEGINAKSGITRGQSSAPERTKAPQEATSTPPKTSLRSSSSTAATVSNDKKERQQNIISIIEEKGNVTIKDISSEITDCSEKTIQRELIRLVSQGVLEKEGERRWSTYSIAKS